MSERPKDRPDPHGEGCCCGRDCLPPEAQEEALRSAARAGAIAGAEGRTRRVLVFLREHRGKRITDRTLAALLRRLRSHPSPAELRQLAELEALIEARYRDGIAPGPAMDQADGFAEA